MEEFRLFVEDFERILEDYRQLVREFSTLLERQGNEFDSLMLRRFLAQQWAGIPQYLYGELGRRELAPSTRESRRRTVEKLDRRFERLVARHRASYAGRLAAEAERMIAAWEGYVEDYAHGGFCPEQGCWDQEEPLRDSLHAIMLALAEVEERQDLMTRLSAADSKFRVCIETILDGEYIYDVPERLREEFERDPDESPPPPAGSGPVATVLLRTHQFRGVWARHMHPTQISLVCDPSMLDLIPYPLEMFWHHRCLVARQEGEALLRSGRVVEALRAASSLKERGHLLRAIGRADPAEALRQLRILEGSSILDLARDLSDLGAFLFSVSLLSKRTFHQLVSHPSVRARLASSPLETILNFLDWVALADIHRCRELTDPVLLRDTILVSPIEPIIRLQFFLRTVRPDQVKEVFSPEVVRRFMARDAPLTDDGRLLHFLGQVIGDDLRGCFDLEALDRRLRREDSNSYGAWGLLEELPRLDLDAAKRLFDEPLLRQKYDRHPMYNSFEFALIRLLARIDPAAARQRLARDDMAQALRRPRQHESSGWSSLLTELGLSPARGL